MDGYAFWLINNNFINIFKAVSHSSLNENEICMETEIETKTETNPSQIHRTQRRRDQARPTHFPLPLWLWLKRLGKAPQVQETLRAPALRSALSSLAIKVIKCWC